MRANAVFLKAVDTDNHLILHKEALSSIHMLAREIQNNHKDWTEYNHPSTSRFGQGLVRQTRHMVSM